jgi:eukaryotic-like serine/threonine-protein kinase
MNHNRYTEGIIQQPIGAFDLGTVSYHCDCGNNVTLDVALGGSCVSCGRHITAESLQHAIDETVSVLDVESANETQPPVMAPQRADSRLGTTLGHYQIKEQLGRGGMGVVYRALDESLQRYVALKVIDPHTSSATDTRQLQRLFQEAIAQARVNHPHVVHIYFVGREEEAPFLAMELVGGPTLVDRLQDGPLPYGDIIYISLQLADALQHCAQFDIVHGDIKPSNILLTESGDVKLSDFGLARRLSETESENQPLAGTPDYMAPELVSGASIDLRSDLYSLGVTLFKMTFRKPPYSYSNNSVSECLDAHRQSPIQFPDPWPAEIPLAWRNVLARLLAKSPDDRYQDHDELIADLRRLQPTDLPKAGRVQRGLAWLVDLALVHSLFQVLTASVTMAGIGEYFLGLTLSGMTAMAGAAAPILASACQAHWRTTPGKRLFQIRIVDRHGLRPEQVTLATRMVFQMLPIWGAVSYLTIATLGLEGFASLIEGIIGLVVLGDTGLAVVRRDGRGLHDLFFDTRVVLDADPHRDKPTEIT